MRFRRPRLDALLRKAKRSSAQLGSMERTDPGWEQLSFFFSFLMVVAVLAVFFLSLLDFDSSSIHLYEAA